MKKLLVPFLCVALQLVAEIIEVPNGGFENAYDKWTPADKAIMAAVTEEQAHTGKFSLKITDESEQEGSNFESVAIRVKGGEILQLSGWFYAVSGSGCGIYLRQQRADGKVTVGGNDCHLRGLGGTYERWLPFSSRVPLDPETDFVVLYFHSYMKAKVVVYIDDLQMETIPTATEPPWKPLYNIKPSETAKLTAADVVGPDGVVYPNWTRCGMEGGIPVIPDGVNIRDFGGIANDDIDDQPAFATACAAAAKDGRAVILNEGTYILKTPVNVISSDGVVIRGQGMGKTVIKFVYALPSNGIRFAWPEEGADLKPGCAMEVHTRPKGLRMITVEANGTNIHTWKAGQHSGNTFNTTFWYGSLAKAMKGDGNVTLKAVASYTDGKTLETSVTANYKTDPNDRETVRNNSQAWRAAINFLGRNRPNSNAKLAQDGHRGDTVIHLVPNNLNLKPGDHLMIDGPATKRWKELTQNACLWGTYRRYAVRVKAVDGTAVTLEQPLRIEFPVIDGSSVTVVEPIQRCGVENLTIEQTEDLWISTVLFTNAWNCWAKNVEVIKCGRFPVYGQQAKFCEIRDSVFRDAWFKGGGGTAYTGWEHSWDCLIDGIETFEYRHAPLFQWSASGCVIRNGVFHNSDAQWHSGWTNENLIENCVIESVQAHGAYGFGMWASPPEDSAHGPNGPRNVVYNCDITSPRAGLWMGGMNECWLILNNRFHVKNGPGVFAKTCSFDHIIRNNVFIIDDKEQPAVRLETNDCFNVEFADNAIYSDGPLVTGGGRTLLKQHGNKQLPLDRVAEAVRPAPAVPSIYEWQLKNVK
ncbi:MAG: right-handed parallel beta-helix repeat-containing protein [Lentisphaeria bacterium]|nr:right-handed parallel beta-helix repeat-containing protein [Lentisphaeria bacterium]